MRLTITIDLDNAAFYFEDDDSFDSGAVVGILETQVRPNVGRIVREQTGMRLRDSNGNTVGNVKVES